jgi:hypothetical protein
MALYSPFHTSTLPMLKPLLYASPRLSPLRPYINAVLARPPVNYGNPTLRWLVIPRQDPAKKQQDAESSQTIDEDPRVVFGETEFRTVREKYNMPKYVSETPLQF